MASILHSKQSIRKKTTASAALLVALIFAILIVPLFPVHTHLGIYALSNGSIFFLSLFAIEKRRRKWFIVASVILIVLKIYATIQNDHKIDSFIVFLGIVFFLPMVGILISQIMSHREVDISDILDAITAYMLLGFACCSVMVFLAAFYPDSYNFSFPRYSSANIYYYGFITFCTVGYGDIIPVQPAAKSLAIFTGMAGQL